MGLRVCYSFHMLVETYMKIDTLWYELHETIDSINPSECKYLIAVQ